MSWHAVCSQSFDGNEFMNSQSNVVAPGLESKESIIPFPMGLLGLEKIQEYVVLADPVEAPSAWLQMNQEPNLALPCHSPHVCL